MRLFSLIIILSLCSSCSVLRAKPAKNTGFIPFEDKLMEDRARAPFNGMWIANREAFYQQKKMYHHVYVLPINTDFLEKQIKDEKLSPDTEQTRIEEVREIANYTQARFVQALRDYPNAPYKVVDEPDVMTFVLELNISELSPTDSGLNLVSTAAGFFVPGIGTVGKQFSSGSVAIEGLIRDGKNGDILLAFKDRETDKPSPFTLRDFQLYAHVRASVDDWAEQYAELAATDYEHTVEESDAVTFSPV